MERNEYHAFLSRSTQLLGITHVYPTENPVLGFPLKFLFSLIINPWKSILLLEFAIGKALDFEEIIVFSLPQSFGQNTLKYRGGVGQLSFSLVRVFYFFFFNN